MKIKKLIAFLSVFLIAAIYLIWGNNSITVSEHSVELQNLPPEFGGYRIVHLSDFHNKNFGSRLCGKIEALSPDIIVVTGDIIDFYSTNVSIAAEFIESIRSIAPIYYVTGNHESRMPEEYESLRAVMEEAGVTVLDGKTVVIEKNGAEICLAGIDDPNFFGSEILGENEILFNQTLAALQKQAGERVGILLSHRPEKLDAYAECGFDLVFSGHAHGGQVRLPFVGGLFAPAQGFFPEYTQGIYESGNTQMIVSRGLGNSLFPLRIFNRPEIVVCDLKEK